MNIGYFLKKIRNDKSLTLNEVARNTNVTASLISQIENEKIYPSINSLESILHYYGIELSDFFEQVEKRNFLFTKRDCASKIESAPEGVSLFDVNPLMYYYGAQLFRIEVAAGNSFEIRKQPVNIVESCNEMRFIYMVCGKVSIEIGNEKFDMTDDDILFLKPFLKAFVTNCFNGIAKLVLSGKNISLG
ncbi:MAG TPA: helix-turn-helix transcriptional regulator [Candidatus Wallbacteria bacterium]|nr:MAG: HTH-type transcriptional regulator PuuR [bacterium ADurb.Bin243]HOD39826.1 helix-turn-helix transcriptional regulator [Candidatus Wallbacteria bacterium]HPG56714.1 helix-turn-helix transcriptional regulator [Candidatus Wallbacteria bacterium]